MLYHPCEYNSRFIYTEPEGQKPEDVVRINQLLHKQLGVVQQIYFQLKTYMYGGIRSNLSGKVLYVGK